MRHHPQDPANSLPSLGSSSRGSRASLRGRSNPGGQDSPARGGYSHPRSPEGGASGIYTHLLPPTFR